MLYLCNHFFRHPLHTLEGFCRSRAPHVEDHGLNAHLSIVSKVGCNFLSGAKETPALTRCDLFFAIEQRTFQSDADVFRVSSRLLGVPSEHLQVSGHIFRLQRNGWHTADGMPAVAQFAGAAQCLFAMAADPNRNGWLLHRLGQKNDIRETVVLAVERWIFLGPKFSEGANVLIRHPAPLAERRRFQVLEFLLHPAHAQANDYSALRKNIKTSEHLGREDGIPIGRDHDAGDEADALRGA